ncbi:MAG: isoleucine--tRNA ligase [Gammaproteobacteria bacterium]|nr:isoleucine--tRNA ligase [Gammaproteobacteria bacterium]
MTTYSVNLPETGFPMKANLPTREPKMLEFWQQLDLYKSFITTENSRGNFVLHDGPPYSNGDIHLGHAFNKVIKDIINKSKLLEGYNVPYVPGWDCHGLPIELNVEKKIGKAGVKVSVEEFIAACRKYAIEQIQIQMKGFQRLGVVADWENFYSTMDFKYEANIVRSLMQIVDAGYVVRGYKPVHWCIACGSALAEAEVEYQDKVSPAIDIRFRVINPEKFKVTNLSIPIWTTTPWTLPANEAVCVHPKLKYVLVNCATLNEHFIIAEDLLSQVMQRYGEGNYKVEKVYIGEELQGLQLRHPFLDDKTVPVVLGDHVTFDIGTGAVHTAPAHGQDDYKVGLQNNLPIKNPVAANGKFLESTRFFAGKNVFEANPDVIVILKEHDNLIHEETLQHSYPHCWRHKTPLIFRATQQWFISMDGAPKGKASLRQQAQDSIVQVKWLPAQGENSIKSMVNQRPDWCISRQRFWGLPIALLVHKETGEIHPEMGRLIEEIIAPNIEKIGLVYWHQVEAVSFLKEHAKNKVDAENYEKVTDTLDVWFNSGVSHFCVLKQRPKLHFPADLYIEGSDQYRGWFQSSLLTALAMDGEAPYKTVVTHGFTVDAKGHKMSKSLGNVISPQQIIDKYGADVLRLWVGSSYLHDDLVVSDEIFARTIDVYRTLRNTARFLLGNLFDFNPVTDLVPAKKMLPLDRWAVTQVLNLAKHSRDHYDLYQFHTASNNLQVILANDISSFYFSVIKDRLYTMAASGLGRRSAQTALFHILEILVRLTAPILSFTAEEIWQEMREMDKAKGISSRAESVFMSRWSEIVNETDFDLTQDQITDNDWSEIKNYRAEVNKELEKLRVSGVIGSSLAAFVTLYCDDKILSVLRKLKDELRFVLITSSAAVSELSSAPEDAIVTGIPGLKLAASSSPYKKCSRCWHYCEDVGSNQEHPELCGRCVENLEGAGEIRLYA